MIENGERYGYGGRPFVDDCLVEMVAVSELGVVGARRRYLELLVHDSDRSD